ncbi:GbsR/MarR family transcriptional regulator [Terrilactibacillus sp. BCM23-1]|uniref:HTH-type transcriptional regulator n=1 Tax=Terrilactibacillus tamarindi TaxID=2599694 RepID=A0A6N8CUE4_9BACI|nr:GbsR/MarR family transcriptional regulator [Terrilactibacillus tamarindi]
MVVIKLDKKTLMESARERVIETISHNMYLYGVTPSIGRLYGTLFFNDKPMTLDEMKEELKMSKTSMSTSVRTLTDLNMVEKVWKKGIRKDLYEAKKDWYQIFIDFFSNEWRKVISLNVKAINQSMRELKTVLEEDLTIDEKETVLHDLEKFNYAIEYYKWLNQLFDYFESNQIFDLITKQEIEKELD